ncbi:DNA-binding transcriptional regulator, AcrR family [Flexibacter flexilis DSM 6793]|uniref:DNA-binding transcriptional regulator, AcrR family n=1 Tax=Flexibacter flexilis DSM 6793 TaxID=927664 RepID=A0A1I1KYP4_9BACT|nr:TetR family transcriptional regulator C-terminal domain-containing protein [Flexibacter flexilis]SFC63828.1 DNA-binding transcriptional regulator, AcrR family [Flexibacter flexilis DSM 6793]
MSKKAAAAEETSLRDKIRDNYIDFILTNGQRPASVYAFAKQLGISEADFYTEFATFEAIENSVWADLFQTTLTRLEGDAQYQQYGAREKLLAFYFTWIESLKTRRSYVTHLLDSQNLLITKDLGFKKRFVAYVQEIVNTGVESGEVQKRAFLADKYADALWLQLLFVLNFWVKDNSTNFEQTDAAIEKAVNLSFDLMGHNALDTVFDFAKFLVQSK